MNDDLLLHTIVKSLKTEIIMSAESRNIVVSNT